MMDEKPTGVPGDMFTDYARNARKLKMWADRLAAAAGLLDNYISSIDGRCEQRDLESLVRLCSLAYRRMHKHCAALGIGDPQPESEVPGDA